MFKRKCKVKLGFDGDPELLVHITHFAVMKGARVALDKIIGTVVVNNGLPDNASPVEIIDAFFAAEYAEPLAVITGMVQNLRVQNEVCLGVVLVDVHNAAVEFYLIWLRLVGIKAGQRLSERVRADDDQPDKLTDNSLECRS